MFQKIIRFILLVIFSATTILLAQNRLQYDDPILNNNSGVSQTPAQKPINRASKTLSCPSAFNISTPYNQNNGQAGQMFDITAINPITIRCFENNLYAGTAQYRVYYKMGTHVGFETKAAAWTEIGTAVSITSNGLNVPTPIPTPINISIPARQTAAFYLTCDRTLTHGGGNRYTNGTAVGNIIASDGNLQIKEGIGKAWSYSTNFVSRLFNGGVFYDATIPLNIEIVNFKAKPLEKQVELSWEALTERGSDYFTVERSANNRDFEAIGNVNALRNSGQVQHSFTDGTPLLGTSYYRLRIHNQDGKITTSSIATVFITRPGWFNTKNIHPNPAKDHFLLEFEIGDAGKEATIGVYSFIGSTLLTHNLGKLNAGSYKQKMSIATLPAGIYFVKITLGKEEKMQKLIVTKE